MDWNGEERRALPPERILELARPHTEWSVQFVALVVLVAAVLVLVAASLIGHKLIDDHIDAESRKQETFRRSVSCFLFEITRGADDEPVDRADVLARCGLLGAAPGTVNEEDQ